MYGVFTAHHPKQAGKAYLNPHKIISWLNEIFNVRKTANLKQRRMWIPVHFYPANEGNTLSEKLICRKFRLLVIEMFNDHIKHMEELPYVLQLIGIASQNRNEISSSHYGSKFQV